MLIATLPTLTSQESLDLSQRIISHPAVGAVRYNTGGDSPYTPRRITKMLAALAKDAGKNLYLDLEGRQVRIAKWNLQSRGAVTLNRDFELELPGIVNFRGSGWFKIVAVEPSKRKFTSSRAGPKGSVSSASRKASTSWRRNSKSKAISEVWT